MKSKLNLIFAVILFSSLFVFPQESHQTNNLDIRINHDSTGIYAENYAFNSKNLYTKNVWNADWIWLNNKNYPNFQYAFSTWINNDKDINRYRALFRKKFSIQQIPETAVLFITGDVSFRAYLNGNYIFKGPPNIGSDYEDRTIPEHWFYSTIDISAFLRNGENILAVEVFAFDLSLSETTSGEGKFICEIENEFNQTIIKTDSTWKGGLDTSYYKEDRLLVFNANHEDPDWTSIDYDDRQWHYASLRESDKDGYLTISRIPTEMKCPVKFNSIYNVKDTKEIEVANEILYSQSHYYETFKLDVGRNMSALYSFVITANKNDTIKFYPREKKRINRPFVYICRDGINRFSIPYLNVFRYLVVEISSEKGLSIDSLNISYTSYPVNYLGNFECSDPFLSKLWDITRWTTQMCMQSLYFDSPLHQEPLACTGDYLIESLSNFYAFGDPWLVRQDLIKTSKILEKNDYDMFHTSYSLLWVQWLSDYFQHTADTALVIELLPHVNKLNDLFSTYLDEMYLLTQAPDYMFMDWIKIDKFNAHHPPAVIGTGYLTAFYYKSLIESAAFNQLLKNDLKNEENLILAEKIKAGMNKWLWDESKELYKDGIPFASQAEKHFWLPEDQEIITYSPHINTLAVLYNIAPLEKQESIMRYVLTQDEIDLQPYFTYYVLSALTLIGRFDTEGLNLINKWQNGIDLETYTLKENWQDETEFGYVGDYSHAWGGSPLFFMSSNILGIKPALPGFKKIRFEPFVSNKISWAKGNVPINGKEFVCVSFEKKRGNSYQYQIEFSKELTAIMIISEKLKNYKVILDGNIIEKEIEELEIQGGSHVIQFAEM